jgi:hypothetical protein
MKTPQVTRVDMPFGRVYAYKENNEEVLLLPSVTTILGSTSSPYLINLEAELGTEKFKQISQDAASRGTAMHKFLENYFICKQHSTDEEKCILYTQKKTPADLKKEGLTDTDIAKGRNLFYNYIHNDVFSEINKIEFTEKFMWSIKHKFAGTSDFGFTDINEEYIIADFKSASGHRDKEVIEKYKKQGAAYVIAEEEINNKKVKSFQIWISHPEGMQIEIIEGQDLQKAKKEFKELSESFHASWDTKPIRDYYLANYSSG